MHVVLISGSHRTDSQSIKVTKYLAQAIGKLDGAATTDIIDLKGSPIPLWDGAPGKLDAELAKVWAPYGDRLKKAEALVIVTPEWNGTIPAGLKNFFHYANAAEVGHKPALITAVSATPRGGAVPVAELRMTSTKNNRLLYIPEHVLVQNANKMLNDGEAAEKDDQYLRARIDYALKMLFAYGKALTGVRASGVTDTKVYKNGM